MSPVLAKYMTFKLNDKVAWASQSQGSARRKVGTVVQVIPANVPPKLVGSGLARPHESYVVSVPGKTARAKPKIYWPVVSLLQPAKEKDVPGSRYV